MAGAPFYGDVALDLAPVGPDSTRATYGACLQMRGLWRLPAPLIAMEGKAGQARELQRLKGAGADATAELPRLIGERRAEIAQRIDGLQALDTRLAGLAEHLDRPRRTLAIIDVASPCCDAADAVVGSAEGACACCSKS